MNEPRRDTKSAGNNNNKNSMGRTFIQTVEKLELLCVGGGSAAAAEQ